MKIPFNVPGTMSAFKSWYERTNNARNFVTGPGSSIENTLNNVINAIPHVCPQMKTVPVVEKFNQTAIKNKSFTP